MAPLISNFILPLYVAMSFNRSNVLGKIAIFFDLNFYFFVGEQSSQVFINHNYYKISLILSHQAVQLQIDMYVEQLILEGFKTYMNRTVITNFDPQFNAITGLNGSGKSNILDAIQFLLGSTSKEMLRLKAGLTELIYKEGFAGIEKASVTIKFRCIDKQMRPTGYQNCDQLIVTRQITKDKITKFFVNGVNSNLSKVRNLFRSVQLNIQNPHFLVKQGQITKIINLKPLELLGMIEETAGTAYYNKTKMESQKIIQKKDQKLKAINEIINQSIEPQMEKLDSDRRRYIAFKDKEKLLHYLDQKLRIFQYTIKNRQLNQKQFDVINNGQTIQIRKKQAKINIERLLQLQAEQKMISNRSTNTSLATYNKLKNLLADKEGQRNQIRIRIQKLNSEAISEKQEAGNKELELEQKRKDKQWHEKILIQADKQKEEIENLLQEFGRSNSEQDAGNLIQKQIMQQESRISAINTEIKIMASKRDTLKTELQNDKKIQAEMQENNANLAQSLKDIQKQIESIQKTKVPEMVDDPQLTNTHLKQLQMNKKRLLSQNYHLVFQYTDPYNGFDRSKVKGKLFMLFRAKQKLHQKALQIGAGARLYNIVVENQIVSKQLIERETFGKNVTIMPNNKIRFNSLKQETIEAAAKIAKELGGLARPAHQLINYPKQIQNTIKFVFSNFIICSSVEIAQRIVYNSNRHLSCKCITYDGDTFDTTTISGGYTNQSSMIIPQFAQLYQIEEKIRKERQGFDIQRQKYEEYQKAMNQYRNKQKQMENKVIRREKIKNKLMNMTLNIKKRDFNRQMEDIELKIKQLHQDRQANNKKLNQLKNALKNKNVKSVQEQKGQLEKQMKKAKAKVAEAKKKVSQLEVQMQEIKLNVKHMAATGNDLQKQIMELEKRQRQISSNMREYQIEFERVQQEKKKHQKQMLLNQAKFKGLVSEQNQLKSAQQKMQREINSLQSSTEIMKKQIIEIKRMIQDLLQKYPWIDTEQDYPIDPSFNYESVRNEYRIVQGEVQKLKRSAKMNIDDHSYQKLNEQYKNLLQKRQTLEKDKVTLLNNMHDLDQKRTKTLEKCFQSVKVNLSKIFNDLLPGATAHLTLIDQRDVTKGAELSVHFNKIKKQLSQLSGGQRSLLALSFILALLLYKPSPFYILDQIDSALDLSHTENIGYMISQRFPQSQFILISLKEGMFQNANVLYKVHFAEGESKVERQVLKQNKKR